jgi:uncharacterized CHY-type Zn-finger protein
MFASKQKQQFPKIKCIITGQVKSCRTWYNCARCQINYSSEMFSEYDGWLRRPRCAMCVYGLSKNTVQQFTQHRRR